MTTVPPGVRAAFLAALRPESDHADALPDPLPVGRVLRLVDPAKESTEKIRVLAGDDGGYYLDFFRRDGESSWHGRIREDGTDEKLENFEGQFGTKVFPDPADTEREQQRIYQHNARVRELLRKKGFED